MCKVDKFLCIYIVFCFSKWTREWGRMGIDALSGPIRTADWESCAANPFKRPEVHKNTHQQLIFPSCQPSKSSPGMSLLNFLCCELWVGSSGDKSKKKAWRRVYLKNEMSLDRGSGQVVVAVPWSSTGFVGWLCLWYLLCCLVVWDDLPGR
jgi:hypothetical protein